MARERYLVLYKDDKSSLMWRVFDILPPHNNAEPWYEYIRSIGKYPGMIQTSAKKWIDQYVEKS